VPSGGQPAGHPAGTAPEAEPGVPPSRRFLSRRGGATGRGQEQKKRLSFWKELPILILIAFVLALLIKAFFVQAFYIPSGSMEQTLEIGDRVLVNKIVYDFRDVHRGEIVVFNGDGTNFQQSEVAVPPPSNVFERILRDIQGFLGLGSPNEKDFIKRVIGVGGDTVSCCDDLGRVLVNGKALDEPYVYYGNDVPTPAERHFDPVHVPKGSLFVMGDHRNSSTDSRMVGTIPEDNVIGRAQIRIWPLSRLAWLRVPSTFDTVPNALGLLGYTGHRPVGAVALSPLMVPAVVLLLFPRRARPLSRGRPRRSRR
jgi:signal peptidase I